MKGFLAAALLLLAATPAAADGVGLGLGIMAGSCSTDSEIAPAERSAIEDAGLTLARTLLGDHPEGGFDLMSQKVQAANSREAFASSIGPAIAQGAPYSPPRLMHTYLLTSTGASIGTGPGARGLCGTVANNAWVSAAVTPGEDSAYVLIDTDSRNNGWTFAIGLRREGPAWHVYNFYFNISSVVGLDAPKLLDMGQREREAGHMLNAYILVTGATYATQRGPDIQLGITHTILTELGKVIVPPELKGTGPFHWTLNGKTFDLSVATLIGVDKQLGIQFDLPQKEWPSNDAADARNREFIDAFRAAYPDYARVFSFIVARAMQPDNSGGFASVYDNKTGYGQAPASPAPPHP
jgi:hypothetical protein